MTDNPSLIFYHAPNSRSAGVRVLLEELGAAYQVHPLNFAKGEQRQPGYLAINPLGKVPAVTHGGALVTEQVAIYIYLADYFSEAGLAPALHDPLRGPYLRWLAYYGSSYEPAIVDQALKREAGATGMSPYGSFDAVIDTLEAALATGPFLLGTKFSAADILWGTALKWTMGFKIVPERPTFVSYVERVTARPAFARAAELDTALAAEMAKS
jgi:glutathione S-transferase